MKKVLFLLILLFVNAVIVNAQEDILIKKTEIAKVVIDEGWINPVRSISLMNGYYFIEDSYYGVNSGTIWATYDMDWNLIAMDDDLISPYIYIGKNYFYSYFNAELGRDDISTYLFQDMIKI